MSMSNSSAPIESARLQETRAPELIGALAVGPSVAFIFVAMRIYTRLVLVRKHFLEDYSIVAALACAIAMSVLMGLTVIFGSGKHIEAVSAADLKEISRVGIGVIQFYALTHFFLKLSIMLQYYRVATLPWEKKLCFAIIALLTAGYLAILVVEMVRCVPFEAQWTPKYPGAVCINSTAFYFSAQGLNVVMDLIILFGPLVILRHSSAPIQQRLLFGIALAFGGAACIVSAFRLQTLLPSTTSRDPTWDKTPSGMYGVIEANLGITCACVVTLRLLFHKLRLSMSSLKVSIGTRTVTAKSIPRDSRKRASLYHITLLSGNNTQLSSDSGDGEMNTVDSARVAETHPGHDSDGNRDVEKSGR
ncbi:hypothetical protein B0T14DRAFT_517183 [Immersiella caudata]|uniref:Rhodopsin domain-containing protein n=1 Tax=Immersiella caudata TaxID=314043 RepID=A0AA40C3Q1_9PEZI|nr:hypothetical protein B0T14DRAFT_517183 [Immersiella caudata]